MPETKSPDKFKVIKVGILKREKDFEDKNPNKTTPFSWHQGKLVLKNLAFWTLPDRGLITADDVKTAIYQLEKAELVEIVGLDNLRLTPKGYSTAKEIWSMQIEEIPDSLIGGREIPQLKSQKMINCPHCKKEIETDSTFCRQCGKNLKKTEEFCSYCGSTLEPESTFCSTCGKKL